MTSLKLGWYLQLEECSKIRQSERIQIYSQSSQTPLTDCFTLTGSSEGNLNNIQLCKNYYYIVYVPQKFNYSYSKTMSFDYGQQ